MSLKWGGGGRGKPEAGWEEGEPEVGWGVV